MAGKRDAEADGDGKLGYATHAAEKGGEIVGHCVFCTGYAGAGN